MRVRPLQFAFLSALLALPVAAEPPENLCGAALPDGAILRIGQPAPSDPQLLGQMLLMPNGRNLLVAGRDGMIRICDLSTGVVLRKMGPQPGGFWREMALSRDGKILASQSTLGPETIFIWDLESGKLLREVPRDGWIAAVALSSDGSVLAWGNNKSPLKLIDVQSGTELPVPGRAGQGIVSLGISADGNRLVASGTDCTVRLFDLRENRLVREFKVDELANVAISPEGTRIVTCLARKVSILDGSAAWKQVSFSAESACRVVVSPDGQLLATSSAGTGGPEPIQVWDMASGAEVSRLIGSSGCDPPVFLQGGTLLLASDYRKLRLWGLPSGSGVENGSGHTGKAYFVSWSEDGRFLLSAGTEGTLRRWDATSGEEISRVATLGGCLPNSGYQPIASLAGNRLALSEDLSVVSIWNLDRDNELKRFEVNIHGLRGMALSPDGKRMASESDGTLVIRLVENGEKQREFNEPEKEEPPALFGSCYSISQGFAAWSPDGRLVAWNDRSSNNHVCDCDSGEMKPISFEGRATCARFSPDGKRLLLGGYHRQPSIVNVETGECHVYLDMDPVEATAIAWSRDGRQVALGETQGRVVVCDSTTGKTLRRFQGSRWSVRAIAFSPRGDRLASAGDDGAILVWNLGEGEKERTGLDFDTAWRDLRATNGPTAAAALEAFVGAGDTGAEELARRLGGETTPEETGRWIRELDSDDPARRESALASLADAGVLVEPALNAAAGTASTEAGAAIRELVARLNAPLVRSCGSLRRLRSLEIIEAVGTPRAKELLAQCVKRSNSLVERGWAAECLHRLR